MSEKAKPPGAPLEIVVRHRFEGPQAPDERTRRELARTVVDYLLRHGLLSRDRPGAGGEDG